MHSDAAKTCSGIEPRAGCIQAALKILGDKWTPLLLGMLVDGKKTFGELEDALPGISPRTLSARLVMLEEEHVVTKHRYCEHPPRHHYDLTEKGRELQNVLKQMAQWGNKYHSFSR